MSQRFYTENGGTVVGDELVPTGSVDFSAYILNIRQAKPDLVYINLAGTDQTNFLKQFSEYNLPIPISGGVWRRCWPTTPERPTRVSGSPPTATIPP